MLDAAASANWTVLLGVPVIAGLLALAFCRARALSVRIRAVREEMARSPQDPYQALAALMAEAEAGGVEGAEGAGRWPKE